MCRLPPGLLGWLVSGGGGGVAPVGHCTVAGGGPAAGASDAAAVGGGPAEETAREAEAAREAELAAAVREHARNWDHAAALRRTRYCRHRRHARRATHAWGGGYERPVGEAAAHSSRDVTPPPLQMHGRRARQLDVLLSHVI